MYFLLVWIVCMIALVVYNELSNQQESKKRTVLRWAIPSITITLFIMHFLYQRTYERKAIAQRIMEEPLISPSGGSWPLDVWNKCQKLYDGFNTDTGNEFRHMQASKSAYESSNACRTYAQVVANANIIDLLLKRV